MYFMMDQNKELNFESSENQNSDPTNTIFDCLIVFFSTNIYCFVESLMEKIKLVVTEKNDFEYRNESIY